MTAPQAAGVVLFGDEAQMAQRLQNICGKEPERWAWYAGARLREIGASARQELNVIFSRKVHLFIYVKVRDKWMDDRSRYSTWGLNFNA